MVNCGDDLTLLALKGHLLLEKQLTGLLEDVVAYPEVLQAANLRFHQKVNMVRAVCIATDKISTTRSKNHIFMAINNLNSNLRNHLAHHLEVRDLDNRVDAFCSMMESICPQKNLDLKGRSTRLKSALLTLFCAIIAQRLAWDMTRKAPARNGYAGGNVAVTSSNSGCKDSSPVGQA
jgi:hypothetical protein